MKNALDTRMRFLIFGDVLVATIVDATISGRR
jgi:hypothetical protein